MTSRFQEAQEEILTSKSLHMLVRLREKTVFSRAPLSICDRRSELFALLSKNEGGRDRKKTLYMTLYLSDCTFIGFQN